MRTCAGLPAPEALARIAETLRLLAHPQRLHLIGLLNRVAAAPVHALGAALDAPQAVTSQHLNLMRRAGLVAAERRGKEVWYSLADRRALKVLKCVCNQGGTR
ncbi:MAG: metalloregulator ArsR/SmtB family transcription factor [Kiritimatiellaeota bacterium]|nr:metalloregulator ArsR/SmtB family transcription factor [Kiritimatiellota bacterium]